MCSSIISASFWRLWALSKHMRDRLDFEYETENKSRKMLRIKFVGTCENTNAIFLNIYTLIANSPVENKLNKTHQLRM